MIAAAIDVYTALGLVIALGLAAACLWLLGRLLQKDAVTGPVRFDESFAHDIQVLGSPVRHEARIRVVGQTVELRMLGETASLDAASARRLSTALARAVAVLDPRGMAEGA